ncbi:MAG TPA: hypothetical protein VHA15_06310 [Burkholderiales bacterium]|nr:hypothetical protein [Burkholderiales bacterium]
MPTMRHFATCLLACLLSLAAAIPAFAERNFPQRAKRGEMTAFQYPYMKVNGRTLHMSAGSRIFNEQNLIIMPASLQAQKAQIMFALDIAGDLSEVWLLSAEEAKARPLPKPLPAAGGTGGRPAGTAQDGSKN